MSGMHQMNLAQSAIARSLERLATGKRINRGSDDPAGMIAVTNLAAQRQAISADIANNERQLKLWAAADGAESVVGDMLSELNSLVVQAANRGGMSLEERQALQTQADSIFEGLDHLTANSKFNGINLLAGYDADDAQPTGGAIPLPSGRYLVHMDGLRNGGFDLVHGNLEQLQGTVKSLSDYNSSRRALLGSSMQGNESRIRGLQAELIGAAGAQSMIEDTDMAKEISELIRGQTLSQAAMYGTMSALNQRRDSVLSLLG